MPVPYFHVVYTLPSQLRYIAYQNKRVVYDILMRAAADTTLAIAADPKRLGAKIGITSVLHTWGSALTHHPHVHMIVPGGGISLEAAPDAGGHPKAHQERWIASRGNFLVHVDVLSKMFRGKFLAMLREAHADGKMQFFNSHAGLADARVFKRVIGPLHRLKWVVYCKPPFAGPEQVLRYLSRYTHRVAISNRRLIAADDGGISFRWKDYRVVPKARDQGESAIRWKTMTLHPHEFIRRFLVHVLPKGLQRIRHAACPGQVGSPTRAGGLFANGNRKANIARARELLGVPAPEAPLETPPASEPDHPSALPCPCPRCGGRMIVIEIFERGSMPRHRASPVVAVIRIDTS